MIDVDIMNTIYQDIITLFVLSKMLHHVGMLWIIETHEQLQYVMDKQNSEWMTGGPWYNTSICKILHRKVFEGFIINARTDRYNIMCSIDAHENIHPSEHYDGISGDGYPIPSNSTTGALVLLGVTIDFIGCWLEALEHNVLERCHMYIFTMKKLFLKSQLKFLNKPVQSKNINHYYMLLEVVGM